MSSVQRARNTMRKRTVLYAVGCALGVLLLVAGFVFANTVSVSRVTNNARALHWNNSAVGTAALTRAGLVQAVTFAQLDDEGIVTSDDVDFAIEQAEAAHGEIEYLVATADAHQLSFPPIARFESEVRAVLDALRAGDGESAHDLVVSDVEAAYGELATALDVEQTEVQQAIEDNSAAGRSLNAWVVFIVTLAVPGSAVAVYFIVARRQMRAERQRHLIELEAEREISRAKDSFIAGLSHELRTPLTSIYGFAEILSDGDVSGQEAMQETAGIIANEAAEMTRMVDDLLTASRLSGTGLEIELTAVRVSDVVEAAVAPFHRAGLIVERERGPALALADGARLRHVLVNLLSNAARHGGPQINVVVTANERTVEIEVADNGPGVDEERLGTMFERFAHDGDQPLLTGSIGLGLAIAAHITKLMGGNLRYQRYQGMTYFIVSLPTAPGGDESTPDDESVAEMIKVLSSS
jgi:signal transduction histidine kinase